MERFLATPEFRALYKERYQILYEQIYVDDLLTPKVKELAAVATDYNAQHNLFDQVAYDSAVDSVLAFVQERHAFLQTTPLLSELSQS